MKPLRFRVYPTVPSLNVAEPELAGSVPVAIDVLRATSTIAQALWAGATAVIPVLEPEEARMVAGQSPAADRPLLAGERGGVQIPGFDLGNSPREMTPERVAGREIVLTTSNGTRAIHCAAALGPVYTAAFVNLDAVAGRLAELGRDVTVLCAGGRDQFALEDIACAGALAHRLQRRGVAVEPNDLGWAALELYQQWQDRLVELFRRAEHGRRLLALDLEPDLVWCARRDELPVVPCYRDGRIQPL